VELGRKHNVPTPVNEKVIELVERAEKERKGSPKIRPDILLKELNLLKQTGSYFLFTFTLVASLGILASWGAWRFLLKE